MIDERKTAKQQRDQAKSVTDYDVASARYQSLDKQVKNSCRSDKKAWLEQKGTEAQDAADRNDSKTLYRIVRELTGAHSYSSAPIKDKSGNLLLTKEEQDARWIEHFKETLNQPSPHATFDFAAISTSEELDVDGGNITAAETIKAIQAMKNNKAAGLDEITAELLKYGGDSVTKVLTSLFNECWQKSKMTGVKA